MAIHEEKLLEPCIHTHVMRRLAGLQGEVERAGGVEMLIGFGFILLLDVLFIHLLYFRESDGLGAVSADGYSLLPPEFPPVPLLEYAGHGLRVFGVHLYTLMLIQSQFPLDLSIWDFV